MSPRLNPFDEDVKFLQEMFKEDAASMKAIIGDAPPMNKKRLSPDERGELRGMLRTDPAVLDHYVKKYGQRLVDEFLGSGT